MTPSLPFSRASVAECRDLDLGDRREGQGDIADSAVVDEWSKASTELDTVVPTVGVSSGRFLVRHRPAKQDRQTTV